MNNLLSKKIIIFLTITLLFLGFSCSNSLTKKLWNDNFYNEVFYHFLISKDGQCVVLLNDKYHYYYRQLLSRNHIRAQLYFTYMTIFCQRELRFPDTCWKGFFIRSTFQNNHATTIIIAYMLRNN